MTQRIAVGLTLLAALFATACGDDPKPQPAEATLVFRTQPGSVRAGEKLGDVEVALVDASGNVLTDRGGTVQLTLTGAPEGASLEGATRATLNQGVTHFTSLSVAKAAAGMKLSAQMGSQTAASAAFTVRPAPASVMALTSVPTDVDVGGVLSPVAVTLHDAYGNIPEEVSTVTVALEGGTTGATLSGNTRAQTVAGVATFNELTIDEDGQGYVLAFSSGSFGVKSATFNVRPGVPASVSFTTQPADSTVAGSALASVRVTVLDSRGKVAKKAEGNVSLELVAGNGATLGGTASVAVANGVATFDALSIQKAGTGYTLKATFGALAAVDSSAFAITPAAAARLAYVTGPGAATAGAAISPSVQVELQDAYGNRAASTATVAVALKANPGSTTLHGTPSVAAVAGLATFADLSIDVAARGYTLEVTSGQLAAVTSGTFDVAPAAAAALVFTGQPSNAVAGEVLAPAIEVTIRDAFGNTVPSTDNVTLALAGGAGAVLGGTVTVAAVNGVARFSAVHVQKAGTGYTLKATSGSLPEATSSTFAITPAAAARLAYVTGPGASTAGEAISPAVQVELLDAYGNRAASTATVAVALGANPGSTMLHGTLSVAAVAGLATFSNLSINVAALDYTLVVTSGQLESVASVTFDVASAAAAALAFTAQPSNAVAGEALAPAVEVTIRDAFGNTVPSTDNVTLALEGGAGAVLGGTVTVAAVNGVARFSAVHVQKAGTGYTLKATSGSLPEATSSTFAISAAAAAKLVVTREPSNGTAGAALNPGMRVSILDGFDNLTASTASVTVALATNPAGGVLLGTVTESAVAGVATFGAVRLEKAGTGYSLRATADGLSDATSASFDIAPAAAASLAFSSQPTNGVAGQSLAAFEVTLSDAYGNVANSSASVTLALGANPGGGTLGGTVTVAAVAGVARFTAVNIQKAAAGYTLRATSGALPAAESGAFDIVHAAPASLAFLQQPSNIAAGDPITPAVQVAASDAFGNRTTNTSGNVSLALGANPGGGSLTGTTSVALSNGVATFAGLSVTQAGTGYTLSATLGAVPAATSNTFNVASAVTSLAFLTNPGSVTAGNDFSPVVQVELRDSLGNRASSSATVTLRLANNPTGASLSGTVSRNAVNGLVQFTGLGVRKAGTGYTLEAAVGSLTAASTAFNVTAGAMAQLGVTTQPPATVVAGAPMSTIIVEAQDAYGNRVSSFGSAGETVSAAVDPDNNPHGASVGGTREVDSVNGVATFPGLSLDKVGDTEMVFVAYNAAFTALYVVYSRPVTVTPAAASAIAFAPVAATTPAGSAMGPAVQVRVTDRFGNATSGSGDVTLALGANPGGDTLRGTLTAAVSGGVATFPDLVLQKAGQGYTLKARLGALTPATSAPFAIVGGAPTRVEFSAQPRSTPNGLPLNAVAVRLVDAFGNTATSQAAVSLALGNANGAVLGGTVTVAAQSGVARFTDLTVDRSGQGYVLAASAASLVGADSSAFDVYGATLAYTDPAGGRIRLMRNPASTNTQLVLDVVAAEDLSGYGVGFNLPVDATKVRLAAQGAITAGAILSAGASVPAVAAVLPSSGPMAGVLTSGLSQKAAGSGAVTTDTAIPTGSVLYQLKLELAPGAESGVVFDGANLGGRFKGLLRNKLGDDVVGSSGFGIGRLEIAADPGFQKTASR
ncbi:beta strand repeat-containing protein [Pyxidicoccus sp. MSG2]|uniref:beta strand repeat-containing protein n=1 Tax=Pyxidicoccus sp. MSG2 TaxID=2996790 RepID=UPI00226E08FB|nr:hypothetical protein [Pyxidicoccus sp. MSG2]MCY1017609.1 hypothetical protein [Pyxidicoccus sp. MSG2]